MNPNPRTVPMKPSPPPMSPWGHEWSDKFPHLPNATGTQVIDVTPAIAKFLLAGGGNKRPVRPHKIKMYAKAMTLGEWMLTHQCLAITATGRVLDGQHRLNAIIQSGEIIRMKIEFNADPATFETIDTGIIRDPKDLVSIRAGQPVSHDTHSMMGACARGITPRHTFKDRRMTRSHVYQDFCVTHLPVFERIQSWKNHDHMPGITTGTVMGIIARAIIFDPNSEPEVQRFLEVLISGVSVEDRDQNIIRLRDTLIRTRSRYTAEIGAEIARKTEYVLKAWLHHKVITRINITEQELFPLPLDAQLSELQ